MNIITNPKKLRGFERYVKVDNVSRRSILKGLGLAGGFVLAAPVMSRPGLAAYQTGAGEMPHGTVVDPRVFVAIAPDGIVTIVAHRAEMGTGVRTSLPMIVAEEMEADWSRVRVQQAHGDEVKFGNQDTDGSRSTRHYLMPMRQIGASARTMLEGAAAKRWGVPATEVKAVNHEVVHSASGRRIGFGDLAADAAKESVPSVEGLKLKDPKDFRYLGKGQIGMVDLRDITVGTARYGADVRLPGMKYAVIARPPVTGGKVVVVRRGGGNEGFRRREGHGSQGLAVAFKIPAARRRRRDRAQHRRGDQGPRRPEDRLGRWPQRQIRLGRLPGRTGGSRTEARPGAAQGG